MRTGIDLIEIERVARALERHGERMLTRLFTAREQADANGRVPSLAARFAAKEAAVKALGTGIGPVAFTEIEIVSGLDRQPELHLHGAAQTLATQLGLHTWAVSLSHTHSHAIAIVIAS
jgi:holo-[acyl-carrier protein] synthase